MSKTISFFAVFCILSVIEIPIHGMKINIRGPIVTQMMTPFNEQGELNVAVVPRLAKYCAENNLQNIYLLEISADVATLNLKERIALVAEWIKQAVIYGLKLIVEVGLQTLVDTILFAKYCSKQNTSVLVAIAYFPEAIYKAYTREEAIKDLKRVSDAAPNIPLISDELLIVDIKIGTEEIYQAADQVPTLAVMETTPNTYFNIKAIALKRNISLWTYNIQFTYAAFLFELNSVSVASCLFPTIIKAMAEAAKNCDRDKAKEYQGIMNSCVLAITNETNGNTTHTRTYFSRLKAAFELISGIPLGTRPPFEKTNSTVYGEIATALKSFGIPMAKSIRY